MRGPLNCRQQQQQLVLLVVLVGGCFIRTRLVNCKGIMSNPSGQGKFAKNNHDRTQEAYNTGDKSFYPQLPSRLSSYGTRWGLHLLLGLRANFLLSCLPDFTRLDSFIVFPRSFACQRLVDVDPPVVFRFWAALKQNLTNLRCFRFDLQKTTSSPRRATCARFSCTTTQPRSGPLSTLQP